MEIIVHRGTNQIGGTCIEIRSSQARLIFDIGDELPDIENPKKIKTDLTVSDLFIGSDATDKKIDGIFISHNHGDHIGLINRVQKDIPIFIGKTALDIQNTICSFTSQEPIKANGFLENEVPLTIKDIIVTPFLIDHSAYDAYAFVIESEGKKIIYTGDFRRHGSKGALTDHLAKHTQTHNPDVLLIEGTNLYKDNFVAESENSVGNRIESFMKEINGNVFVLQSSANIDRLEQIYNACIKTNRTLVVDIFTTHIISNIPDKRFKKIKMFYSKSLTGKMFETPEGKKKMYRFKKRKIPNTEFNTRRDLCVLVRESMFYELNNRIDYKDSGLIYSKWDGYKKSPKTEKFLDFFKLHNLKIESIHTSGHADIQTIKDFVAAIKPSKIIPVHTETPEKYKELFGDVTDLIADKIIVQV